MWMSKYRVPSMNIESPYGGGVSSLPGATGSLLPVKFPAAPVLLAGGPQLGSWQVQSCRSTRPLQGMLPDGSIPLLNRIGNGRLTHLSRTMVLDIPLWPVAPLTTLPATASHHDGESDSVGGGGRLDVPDLSREGPFDIHQDHPHSTTSLRLLQGTQGVHFG